MPRSSVPSIDPDIISLAGRCSIAWKQWRAEMALTQPQSDILRTLAKNRSETSYLAGGLMLNKDRQGRSDHIDIFHDSDEEVTEAAKADLAELDAGPPPSRRSAVNKVLAASGRSEARDIADLVAIGRNYCPLGPLIFAAAGKPPNFSPRRTIDEIRRHALSIPVEEFAAQRPARRLVRGVHAR
jgi:hypothetical protein